MSKTRFNRRDYLRSTAAGVAGFLVLIFLMGCASQQVSRKESAIQLPRIEGMKGTWYVETYAPDRLYEYIGGAADFYRSYDFQNLLVADCQTRKKSVLLVEIYRHRTPLHAFGVYSQERPREGEYLEVGAQGYIEPGTLNFLSGPYYVKIRSSSELTDKRERLLAFARDLAAQLDGESGLPAILACFPEEGKLPHSETFIATGFLGYNFFPGTFVADYKGLTGDYQVFIVEGEGPEQCRAILETYLAAMGAAPVDIPEGQYTIDDPYHGTVQLQWCWKYLWGVVGLEDEELCNDILSRTGSRIE